MPQLLTAKETLKKSLFGQNAKMFTTRHFCKNLKILSFSAFP